jgi:hypothetical protein
MGPLTPHGPQPLSRKQARGSKATLARRAGRWKVAERVRRMARRAGSGAMPAWAVGVLAVLGAMLGQLAIELGAGGCQCRLNWSGWCRSRMPGW